MPVALYALRRKNPRARMPGTAFPELSIFIDSENIFLEEIWALCIQTGLTLRQALDLVERSERIDAIEQRVGKRATH